MTALASPFLDDRTSPLDARQRAVVRRISEAERAHILALPSNDPLDPKLRFRVEATGPELLGQPSAITSTISANAEALDAVAARLAGGVRRIFLVGCGDSLAVMVAAQHLLETAIGVPCDPVQSLEFAYYRAAMVDQECAVILLSSSGETTRTVEALLLAQHRGAYTVSLTNTAGSTLQNEADTSLKIEATRVGWPTQSSTAALALLFELGVRVAEHRQLPVAERLRDDLDGLPAAMGQVLSALGRAIADIAEAEVRSGVQTVLFAGAGPNLAAAIVGAAKVKECTVLHAVDIQTEEYHHYNSQKADEPLFVLAPSGPSVPRSVDTGTDALRWGGRLYVFTTEGERAFDGLGGTVLTLPAIDEALSPLLYLLPAQLVGYHLGLSSYAAAARV
ncbi:MAG: SIS domain-containing protein [Mycobacterium sp.]